MTKRDLFENERFRKYGLYAVGEMALIVFGILIALQIDNWNTDRKELATLNNYLRSIATNISGDLAEVESIRERREANFEHSTRVDFIQTQHTYSIEELEYAHRAIRYARKIEYLSPNVSGFEALKNSGGLDQLQGTDLEKLIYEYYDTVSRIERAEASHNEYVRQMWLRVQEVWPLDLGEWEMADPSVITAHRRQELLPSYRELLQSPYLTWLFEQSLTVGSLLLEYEYLGRLGAEIIAMVDSGRLDLDPGEVFPSQWDPDEGMGYPDIIVDGRISWHAYWLISGDAYDYRLTDERILTPEGNLDLYAYDYRIFEHEGDALRIRYPGGADWAGFWLAVGNSSMGRLSLDYSDFDRVLIELKGDIDGEPLRLTFEDRTGSEGRVEVDVTLSDEWKTYEIGVAELDSINVEEIRVAIGFLFIGPDPKSFQVRNVRYVAD